MKDQVTIATERWHSFRREEIFRSLKTSENGLNQDEVNKRIQFYGENTLPEGKKVTLLQIILHQLLNPLIFILVAAAIASVAIGEEKDALFIFLVIFINSALGAYQEYNAEKSAGRLIRLYSFAVICPDSPLISSKLESVTWLLFLLLESTSLSANKPIRQMTKSNPE